MRSIASGSIVVLAVVAAHGAAGAAAGAQNAEARPESTFFPIGVYDKKSPPDFDEAYYRKLFKLLAQSRLNTIKIGPRKPYSPTGPEELRRMFDLAHQQGIRVVYQVGNPSNGRWDSPRNAEYRSLYDHPALVALMFGDEPKPEEFARYQSQYAALRRELGPRTILSVMIGESLDAQGEPAHIPAAPLAQDYTVVYHNPDPEFYVEGPGLVRLGQDRLVAVVPVVPRAQWSRSRRVEHSRTQIVSSGDGGKTWQPLAHLPYYSAAPWVHEGTLYLFANKGGTKYRNDDLLLLRSSDGGRTWSEPVTLFKGHFWNCHTGMVVERNRFYWAVDDLALGAKRGPRVVAGDLSRDPMDPRAWRISAPVPFPGVPAALANPQFAERPSQYLEPNVLAVEGRLRVLATVKSYRQSTAGLCAVLDVIDDGASLDLKFVQYHPMPGGQLKFCVLWDEASRMFWATANLVVDSQGLRDWWEEGRTRGDFSGDGRIGGNDRRFLMLLYGLDGLNWFQAGCVARAAKISQSFMYARPVIDGNDLTIISRTSIDAPNQHDADTATFHRVRDFRRLALNLFPDGDGK